MGLPLVLRKIADHAQLRTVYRSARLHLFDKLEFGGESPLTIRAWCSAFRYCPDPLGIVTAEQLDKLEFTQFLLLHLRHEILQQYPHQ